MLDVWCLMLGYFCWSIFWFNGYWWASWCLVWRNMQTWWHWIRFWISTHNEMYCWWIRLHQSNLCHIWWRWWINPISQDTFFTRRTSSSVSSFSLHIGNITICFINYFLSRSSWQERRKWFCQFEFEEGEWKRESTKTTMWSVDWLIKKELSSTIMTHSFCLVVREHSFQSFPDTNPFFIEGTKHNFVFVYTVSDWRQWVERR